MVTIIINILFIIDTNQRLSNESKNDGMYGWKKFVPNQWLTFFWMHSFIVNELDDERPNSLKLQESLPKSVKLEVLSSQSKVTITIDGATVSLEPQ